MRLNSRLGTIVTVAVLAGSGLAVAAAPAGAAPGVRHCGYPPAQCGVTFDRSSYQPGQDATFSTGPAFGKHMTVHGTVTCSGGYTFTTKNFRSNGAHRVNGEFKIPKNAPAGSCQLTLTDNSGDQATGAFTIRSKHHGHSAIAGQSSGGAQVLGLRTTRSSSQGAPVTGATTAEAAPSATGLPFTGGAYTIPMTVAGLALLSGGSFILMMVRRRRANARSAA